MADARHFKVFRYQPLSRASRARGSEKSDSLWAKLCWFFSSRKYRGFELGKRYRMLQVKDDLHYISQEMELEGDPGASVQNGLYDVLLVQVNDECTPVCFLLYFDDGRLKLLLNQVVETEFEKVKVRRNEFLRAKGLRVLRRKDKKELFSMRDTASDYSVPWKAVNNGFLKYLVHLQSSAAKKQRARLCDAWQCRPSDPLHEQPAGGFS